MITRIEARAYRCLRAVDQDLGAFRALVGPNGSGKSTFLDVVGLLSDIMRSRGQVVDSIHARSGDFEKLVWKGNGSAFELSVEARIPERVRVQMAEDKQQFDHVRYQVEIGLDSEENAIGLNHETLWLVTGSTRVVPQRTLFPAPRDPGPSILVAPGAGRRAAITKKAGGNDNYYTDGRKTYQPSFKLGRGRAALANLPADAESFPVSTWFRDLLETGVQTFVLNSLVIRQPSPPGLGRRFQTDGSNLPWVVAELRKDTKQFAAWLDHVRTALEDVVDIDTVERPEDRHRYLVVEYANDARVPSWLTSDGTLRLLALTVPAYLTELEGTFLIEEPENGIHPRAMETVIQSLSSMYRSQVLIATHSPVAINMLKPHDVLCFAKDDTGATDIVSGDRHPALMNWKKGEPDLGLLFASGILS